jgi:outer membrane immunogenic protein
MRQLVIAAVAVVGFAVISNHASAQSTDEILQRLTAKLEQIEKENAALRDRVRRLEGADSRAPKSAAAAPAKPTSPGLAADLGARPAYKAPPMVAPLPVFSWTGCYVGAQGGYGWGKKYIDQNIIHGGDEIANISTSPIDIGAVIFGGQIGCDYQFAGNFVLGIEGSLAGTESNDVGHDMHNFAGMNSGGDNMLAVKTDRLASVTGRLGFTGWSPQTLFYVKGGVAWAHEKFDFSRAEDGTVRTLCEPCHQTGSGWTVGGGIEWAFAPNWSAFIEYDHYHFGPKHLIFIPGTPADHQIVDIRERIEVVTIGVNYRFNWWGGTPVVARY